MKVSQGKARAAALLPGVPLRAQRGAASGSLTARAGGGSGRDALPRTSHLITFGVAIPVKTLSPLISPLHTKGPGAREPLSLFTSGNACHRVRPRRSVSNEPFRCVGLIAQRPYRVARLISQAHQPCSCRERRGGSPDNARESGIEPGFDRMRPPARPAAPHGRAEPIRLAGRESFIATDRRWPRPLLLVRLRSDGSSRARALDVEQPGS